MRMRPIALAIGACALSVLSVRAATLIVTTTADSGPGSLRDTIAAASNGDTIQFDAALNGQTITLTSAELTIAKDLAIIGPGPGLLTVSGAAGEFLIFHMLAGHTVVVEGLTISGADAHHVTVCGGGIRNDGATLTINNCTISGNRGVSGAGICSDGSLTIVNSTIDSNQAVSGSSGQAGGISIGGGSLELIKSKVTNNYGLLAGGGIYRFAGTITIIDSTISGNTAGIAGGGLEIEVGFGGGLVDIRNSTISGNTAAGGGGIYHEGGTLMISNSTLSGNFANSVVGPQGGGIDNSGSLAITNSTVSGNGAGSGGGIYNRSSGTFEVGNTVLNEGSGGNIFNNGGTITSRGFNLSSDNGGGFLTAPGDQINTNPMLGPLQDNGGPTFTHELLIGSPALNAGNPNFTPPPDFDQRGSGFPRVFNGRIDIGSFELQTIAPTPTATATATASPTPTATATATPTAPHTPTPTATATATATPTAAATSTPTATATPIATTTLLNISTRLRVLTGDKALIGGFIVTGNTPKRVIVRAIGPSLTNFGVPGALVDPALELHGPGAFVTITNDNWRDTQQAEIEATGIAPSNDLESAIVAMLPPGAYTAVMHGNNSGIGVGLVEGYDLDSAPNAQLANISTRGFVESGDNVMIGGFILGNGSSNARVLIRAIGPSLTVIGVPDALTDPTLELHDDNGAIIAANDNWRDTQQAEIEATGIPPSDDRESAIVGTLAPGAYTAIVRGRNNTTGVALVEAYNLGGASTPSPTPTATATSTPVATTTPTPTPTPSVTPSPTPAIAKFSLLTSQAMVGTGDAIMLNAFIITGPNPKRVIVRGLGPSLPVPSSLGDPALELRTSSGTLIATNDNWRSDQEAEIIATGIPPTNDLEAAIVATLNPGSYTVVLRGVNNGTGHGVNDLHDLSPSASSGLTAVGTRAKILTGADILISGIVMPQGGDVLLRVLGPSLTEAGVPTVLADPTLELRDGNGVLLMVNDNWQDDPAQAAMIVAAGLAPSSPLESAIVASLPLGSYTAIARGKNNTTGIGYVQFYSLPHSGPVLKLTP